MCFSFMGLNGNTPRQGSAPVKCLASKVGKKHLVNQLVNEVPSLLFLGDCSYSSFTDRAKARGSPEIIQCHSREPNQESPKHRKINNFPAGIFPNNLQYSISSPSRKFQQQTTAPGAGGPFSSLLQIVEYFVPLQRNTI